VLKSDGVLTIRDHKLSDHEVSALITKPSSESFKFQKKVDSKILTFVKS
jgi:hypothetical protein